MKLPTPFRILNYAAHKLGYDIKTISPRPATLFAKKHFQSVPIKVIEIGAYKGENVQSIIETLNVQKFYAIDPFVIEEGDMNEDLPLDIGLAREKFIRLVDGMHEVHFIEEHSNEAVESISEKVDFIYIDGNHKYERVLEDLENYVPLVKDGGIVSGHDSDTFDVARAVIHYCDKYNIKAVFDFPDWYFVKGDSIK